MNQKLATSASDLQPLETKITALIESSRRYHLRQLNLTMVVTYFAIGQAIVENEQAGKKRAGYGQATLKGLSERLTTRFGKGFSVDNLENMRRFYLMYGQSISDTSADSGGEDVVSPIYETPSRISGKQEAGLLISETPSRKSSSPEEQWLFFQKLSTKFTLSWSHYLFLMGISDPQERSFYEIQAAQQNWSLRELKRQFGTSLYERLALSRDKKGVAELARKGQIIEKPEDIIKDPYILEFLGLPEQERYSESTLEQRIIDKLQDFLLEFGEGFAFVGRQKRITFDEQHFYVDLVFFNRLLRCFVLVDLKTDKLTHQDIGQMQMYVNYYDRVVKQPDENPTVGILLCKQKNDAVVQMTLPEDNAQVFASQYQTVLPKKEQLRELLVSEDLLEE